MSATRTPAVSGMFYPSLPARWRADVRGYLGEDKVARRAVGLVSPHAGYTYSGHTAGSVFAAVHVPATCIVLAPNHTGRRTAKSGGSILLSKAYRTPLGDLSLDDTLGEALVLGADGLLQEDEVAHSEEHAVEVVLPFIQSRNDQSRVVPIVIGWTDWERTAALARVMHAAVGERADVLVVASSDMNHYEPAEVTADKDSLALERLIELDGEGLLEIARAQSISMCGRVPAACACELARLRGRTRGEVVAYSHSGVASGDNNRVVGYAGVLLGVDDA